MSIKRVRSQWSPPPVGCPLLLGKHLPVEVAVQAVLSHAGLLARFEHAVKFDGTNFVEAKLSVMEFISDYM